MSRFLPVRRQIEAVAAAAALAATVAVPVQAADLGRLFFTPQQRAELEKRRDTAVPAVPQEAPVVREVLVTVNGYVGRSNGKTTTWVNGVPQYDTVRSADPSRLPIDAANGPQRVQVGATLDTNRGEVRDVIGDGRIRVNPAPGR
jgi:hypothetical protein